jgi:hypothetical protein
VRQPWVWTLDDGPSDLDEPGADLGNGRLLRYPEASGSLVLTIPFGGSATLWLWSPANQPGAEDWPVGSYDVQLWVLGANSRVDVGLTSLYRVSGTGTAIELYASGSLGVLSCGTTGGKRFQGTTLAQTGQPTAGHRLRLGFTFTHNGGFGGTTVTVGFGVEGRDYLAVPILMANPQIVWNGNTLSFPGPLTGYQWKRRTDRQMDISGGRVAATGVRSSYDEVRIQLENYEDVQFAYDLEAFFAWARGGRQYAFALDPADVVNQALTGGAAAGQKDIPLNPTAAVVAGRRYRLRQIVGDLEEVIQVASVTLNTKATAVSNLKHSYLTGDIFRSLDYFPKMVSADSDLPNAQRITTYALDHLMTEDKG